MNKPLPAAKSTNNPAKHTIKIPRNTLKIKYFINKAEPTTLFHLTKHRESVINIYIDSAGGPPGTDATKNKGAKKMTQTFIHLTDDQVAAIYSAKKAEGMTEDAIFDLLYSIDCNLDEESEA